MEFCLNFTAIDKYHVPMEPRRWQLEFHARYTAHSKQDFLLVAIPASGKTWAALSVAHDFLLNNPKRRLLVVCPTRNVCTQWKKSGRLNFGIQLSTEKFRGHDKDFKGAALTYQAIASNPEKFMKICENLEIMVVFDEIHHADETLSWGSALNIAFKSASKRLSLSGTPFRRQGVISFLKPNEKGDDYVADYRYDYPRALEEGAVRELTFFRYNGNITFQNVDETIETLDCEESSILNKLFYQHGFMFTYLSDAHQKLLEVRKSKPDAGGLILCMNMEHAVWVENILFEITKVHSDLILSDTELTTSTVEDFRDNAQRLWAIAVRQVSEGTDIPRLMVEVYATNYKSLLFFRQAIGRVMRIEKTDFDTEAYVFIPTDPEIVGYAEDIEKIQAEIIRKREENEHVSKPNQDSSSNPVIGPKIIDSSAEWDGITTRGEHHDIPISEKAIEFSKRYGIPLAPSVEIIRDMELRHNSSLDTPLDNEEELATIRRKCQNHANKLAFARNCEPREVHIQWIHLSGVSAKNMTLADYRRKLVWLEQELGYGVKSQR